MGDRVCKFCLQPLKEVLPGVFICTNNGCPGVNFYMERFNSLDNFKSILEKIESKSTKACYKCD